MKSSGRCPTLIYLHEMKMQVDRLDWIEMVSFDLRSNVDYT